jgi:hypothetical protein
VLAIFGIDLVGGIPGLLVIECFVGLVLAMLFGDPGYTKDRRMALLCLCFLVITLLTTLVGVGLVLLLEIQQATPTLGGTYNLRHLPPATSARVGFVLVIGLSLTALWGWVLYRVGWRQLRRNRTDGDEPTTRVPPTSDLAHRNWPAQ